MSKLKALLLTQGMHGMVSQVEGLAKALNLNYKHQEIKLKKFWNFIPPFLTPISMSILESQFIFDSKVIISCGRKSVIPSLALKKKYKEKIFTIHIQDPKVSLDKFDLIICPEHDNITGNNVIKTTGAIHYLSEKEISKENNYLKIDKENKKIIAFIIGGPNKYYTFSEKEIDFLFNKIKSIFTRDKYKLVVIPSYRTPSDIIKKAFNSFGHDHMVIKDVDKKAYLSALSISDYIVVTCDSTSMISEAAITGKPIYVAQMNSSKNNLRFQKFFSQFKQLNIIKDLTDKIDLWSYSKLDEVNRISPLINEKIKKMELFKSLESRTKSFNDPFKHFEINQPLTKEAIEEISNADIVDPKKENLNYDGTRALDGGDGAFRSGIKDGGKAKKIRCYVTKENANQFPHLKNFIEELRSPKVYK